MKVVRSICLHSVSIMREENRNHVYMGDGGNPVVHGEKRTVNYGTSGLKLYGVNHKLHLEKSRATLIMHRLEYASGHW